MKKIIALFLSVLLLALASAAFAKPAVTDFRNNNSDYSTIKTVLVLPVIYDVSIPQSEAFLKEAAEQRWQEQTLKKQDRFPFLLKTPKDVVDRAAFISGQPAEPMTPQQTADLINELIIKSQAILSSHPLNQQRHGKANSIWPWSGGYRPSMKTIMDLYPQVKSGDVISAVDLIRGIGHYAGLHNIIVDGATGLADTNYEGKAQAAIEALAKDDFVFLHLEASDEAGHDGDLELKIKTIEYLDSRIVKPVYEAVASWDEPVCIAVLPDHPTPVEIRTHVDEPVPFLIWHKGIEPDCTQTFDEMACVQGSYGMLHLNEFMDEFMNC